MYIEHQEKKYPCECYPSDEVVVYSGLPEDFPFPVVGQITLCADDDFVLRTDNGEDYPSQTFEDGVLTLSSESDPVVPDDEQEVMV